MFLSLFQSLLKLWKASILVVSFSINDLIQLLLTKGQCCTSVKIETIGGGNFYQGERMGNYGRVSNTPDGRLVYKQTNGDNYLYFLQNQGVSINCMVLLHLKINFWALSSFGWLEDKLVEIQAESWTEVQHFVQRIQQWTG